MLAALRGPTPRVVNRVLSGGRNFTSTPPPPPAPSSVPAQRCGEALYNSKLNDERVREIRRIAAHRRRLREIIRECSRAGLGRRFQVSPETVKRMIAKRDYTPRTLDPFAASEVRRLYDHGQALVRIANTMTDKALAERYRVHRHCVAHVVAGESWKHVE